MTLPGFLRNHFSLNLIIPKIIIDLPMSGSFGLGIIDQILLKKNRLTPALRQAQKH